MSSKLPKHVLPFRKFMLSRQTLSLYRDILKVIRQVSNSDHRNQLKEWARQDFKKNKHEKEEEVIKMLHTRGRLALKELESALKLAQ
ncbi:LYR motif-containing protein 2-like [Limulus polyphemus]|uniref:LYR motif-containing protein 2 n=1 Tax=Limulus polyphemus TaxID=6850 RepID=A0ABM1C539_LIMPO|nr:LYR motif-containing protein 2-like [Limulus polyphemus]